MRVVDSPGLACGLETLARAGRMDGPGLGLVMGSGGCGAGMDWWVAIVFVGLGFVWGSGLRLIRAEWG